MTHTKARRKSKQTSNVCTLSLPPSQFFFSSPWFFLCAREPQSVALLKLCGLPPSPLLWWPPNTFENSRFFSKREDLSLEKEEEDEEKPGNIAQVDVVGRKIFRVCCMIYGFFWGGAGVSSRIFIESGCLNFVVIVKGFIGQSRGGIYTMYNGCNVTRLGALCRTDFRCEENRFTFGQNNKVSRGERLFHAGSVFCSSDWLGWHENYAKPHENERSFMDLSNEGENLCGVGFVWCEWNMCPFDTVWRNKGLRTAFFIQDLIQYFYYCLIHFK